jgi:5-methylcytosine-specific restriction endonuclease McrA
MPPPRLKAEFFVTPDGVVMRKAKPLTRKEWEAIYERDGGVCLLCGKLVKPGTAFFNLRSDYHKPAIDHIVPRARGGQNDPDNLRLLCWSCNSQKGAR